MKIVGQESAGIPRSVHTTSQNRHLFQSIVHAMMHPVFFEGFLSLAGGYTNDMRQIDSIACDMKLLTDCAYRLIKYCLQILLSQSGAFDVLDSPYLFLHREALGVLNRSHTTRTCFQFSRHRGCLIFFQRTVHEA